MELIPQSELYRRMQEADAFQLLRLDGSNSGLPIYDGRALIGSMAAAHDRDESLTAPVLLENLGPEFRACESLADPLGLRPGASRA